MESIQKADEPLQIALETLTERCKQFEQRILDVESENSRLKLICSQIEDNKQDSLNEIDVLRQKNSQLREHNTQLKSNIQMVASENRKLWTKLTSLMEVNQHLGSKLSKINDSLMQHSTKMVESTSTPLVRSKTFTQNDPYKKTYQQKNVVDEYTKISLEVEDLSNKLITRLAEEKCELEAQCHEMVQLQSNEISNGCGFSYPGDDLEESVIENLDKHINDLKLIKQSVLQEKQLLLESINKIDAISVELKCNTCMNNKNEVDSNMEMGLSNVADTEIETSNTKEVPPIEPPASPKKLEESKLMCPICSKMYPEQSFCDLEVHVERHFLEADNISNFVVL